MFGYDKSMAINFNNYQTILKSNVRNWKENII